jgi:hypothetical protein
MLEGKGKEKKGKKKACPEARGTLIQVCIRNKEKRRSPVLQVMNENNKR